MLSISSLMSLCWSNIFLDPYKAERSTIIKPCKVIMESSIQQVMTVQNEKWLFCRYLPKWHNSLCMSDTVKIVLPISAEELYASPKCGISSYQISEDTSDVNRSWRPASSGKDRYLSADILDLPFLSPLRHPMVDNGLGCLEE